MARARSRFLHGESGTLRPWDQPASAADRYAARTSWTSLVRALLPRSTSRRAGLFGLRRPARGRVTLRQGRHVPPASDRPHIVLLLTPRVVSSSPQPGAGSQSTRPTRGTPSTSCATSAAAICAVPDASRRAAPSSPLSLDPGAGRNRALAPSSQWQGPSSRRRRRVLRAGAGRRRRRRRAGARRRESPSRSAWRFVRGFARGLSQTLA